MLPTAAVRIGVTPKLHSRLFATMPAISSLDQTLLAQCCQPEKAYFFARDSGNVFREAKLAGNPLRATYAIARCQKLRREWTKPRHFYFLVADLTRRDPDAGGLHGGQGFTVPQAVEDP